MNAHIKAVYLLTSTAPCVGLIYTPLAMRWRHKIPLNSCSKLFIEIVEAAIQHNIDVESGRPG
jgi:hypothetical protein